MVRVERRGAEAAADPPERLAAPRAAADPVEGGGTWDPDCDDEAAEDAAALDAAAAAAAAAVAAAAAADGASVGASAADAEA